MTIKTHGRFHLDTPLIQTDSPDGSAQWTIRHAVEGVQIFGGIGSGKTSGSGRALALKYLTQGFGGLVLTVKADEKDQWIDYCRQTGRLNDLIILGTDSPHTFNFLEYESSKVTSKQGYTENIAEVLKTVIKAGQAKDKGNGGDDNFWEQALDMVIFNIIDLCLMAFGKVTVQHMYDIAQSLPKKDERVVVIQEDYDLLLEQAKKDDRKCRELSAFESAMIKAHSSFSSDIQKYMNANADDLEALMGDLTLSEFIKIKFPQAKTYFYIRQFFLESYRGLYEKTRSIIDFIFSGFVFRLLREPVFSLLCGGRSTVVPEDCLDGKIILLDLPVKTNFKVGRDCQILFKYIWQRAMERRNIKENDRPVFLWADEAQNFLHEHDPVYQATARSSRIATVYITQNLPNYFAAMGGKYGESKVQGFLGTMATKIFHANAEIETNRYASDLVGEDYFEKKDRSVNFSKDPNHSQSYTINLEKVFRPEDFVSLRGGSANNGFMVEGIIHRQGDPIFFGKNYITMAFDQNLSP